MAAQMSRIARESEPMAESVLLGHVETTLRIALSDCRLAAQSVENRGIIPGVSVRVRMLDSVGAFKRGGHTRNRFVDLAENPKHPRHEDQNGHSSVLAGCSSTHSVGLRTCAEHLYSSFECLAGLNDASHEHENHRLPSYPIEQCCLITACFGGPR
jgi:hypothetical protein